MAYDLNSLIRMKDLKVLAQKIKSELQNSGGSGGGSMEWPDSDDKYYAAKNGAWVEVTPAIMIETETGALPSDKYPLTWKKLVNWGSGQYIFWNYPGVIGMFTYNGTTYALGYQGSYSNYLITVSSSGITTKYISVPTNTPYFTGNGTYCDLLSLFHDGYLYFNYNSKIYTLNIAAGDNKLVELDNGYKENNINSCCYSPKLDMSVLIFNNSYVQTMKGTPGVDITYSEKPTAANPEIQAVGIQYHYNKCVWSDELEIFCFSGPNGTAVSSDGLNWTIQLNTGNLKLLKWVPEHHCFYAWKGNVPCMSPDGLTWIEMTDHAISTNTSNASTSTESPTGMTYAPELGIFCVVPLNNSPYMYISNDLKNFAKVDIPTGSSSNSVYWDSENFRFLTTRNITEKSTSYASIFSLEF